MSETPSKGDAESTSPYQTIKDKKCPFCNKDFTSSSLGRHLDLWIKDKNPKQPDGLHDVEEIRRMRGGVTRRQHKKSLGTRRYSSASAATSAATPIAASKKSPAASEQANSTASPAARKDSAAAIPGFNVHNFAVTGVINDIGNDRAVSISNTSREVATRPTRVSQLNMDVAKRIQDAEDTARAAELALREMVSSWRAAKLHIDMNSMPFDFDPLSLDFPALTLQCLQPPPTLSSFNPFPTELSWSIQPPGRQQYTALRAYFTEEFKKWRIKCAAATTALQEDIQYPPSEFAFKDNPQEAVRRAERLADDLEKKVEDHIDTAYNGWEALPQARKQDTWILELARSVGKKQTQIETMQEQQHRLRQENANLRTQIDQLNKLQQPREFKLMLPATMPVDPKFIDFCQEQAVVHGRRTVGWTIDDRRSDIGTVVGSAIDRWRRVIVSSRPSGSGVLGKRTADQAGLNGEEHADNATVSTAVSDKAGPHNKSRTLAGADGRPLPRPERTGTSGGADWPATGGMMLDRVAREAGQGVATSSPSEPNGASSQLATAPGGTEVPRTMKNGQSPSNRASGPAGVQTGGADHMSDKDADAERDDGLSDRDANADKDDGMSDQDADADIEDDDALGYSGMDHAAAGQQTDPAATTSRQTETAGQRHHLPGNSFRLNIQSQAPVPPRSVSLGGGIGSANGSTGTQSGISTVRYGVPDGNVRTPVQPFLHSN